MKEIIEMSYVVVHYRMPPQEKRIDITHGFQLIFQRGGEWSPTPLRGGEGGQMPHDSVTTIGLNSIVYFMVI